MKPLHKLIVAVFAGFVLGFIVLCGGSFGLFSVLLRPTPTPLPTSTPTVTFTPTDTLTPSATFTPSLTYTPTDTFTPTHTPTITFTPSITPTLSGTERAQTKVAGATATRQQYLDNLTVTAFALTGTREQYLYNLTATAEVLMEARAQYQVNLTATAYVLMATRTQRAADRIATTDAVYAIQTLQAADRVETMAVTVSPPPPADISGKDELTRIVNSCYQGKSQSQQQRYNETLSQEIVDGRWADAGAFARQFLACTREDAFKLLWLAHLTAIDKKVAWQGFCNGWGG